MKRAWYAVASYAARPLLLPVAIKKPAGNAGEQ